MLLAEKRASEREWVHLEGSTGKFEGRVPAVYDKKSVWGDVMLPGSGCISKWFHVAVGGCIGVAVLPSPFFEGVVYYTSL